MRRPRSDKGRRGRATPKTTEGLVHHHKGGPEVGEKEAKEEDHMQKQKSEIEGHKEQYPPQRQEDEQQGEESGRHGEGRHGEDSDTDSDISILRWLQGLRKEGAGGQSHENQEQDVLEEEETKEQPRQEETPDKNMNNVAKATHLFKRLTSGYEGWKGAPGVAPPRPAEEPPNYQFNPTYFRSNFCNTTSSGGQTAPEEAQPSTNNPKTEGDGEGFWLFLWRSKRPGRSEHASGMGASYGEGTPKGAPPPWSGMQWTRRLMFHEKFRWQTHHVCAIQTDRILAEKRRRGWFTDYPEVGSNMYLLAPDHVYKVRVLASSVWVPEVRRSEPEVFIISEGINYTVLALHNRVDAKLA